MAATSVSAMNSAVESKAEESARSTSVAEEVKTRIASTSASTFPAIADGEKIKDLSLDSHASEDCATCNGRGKVVCTAFSCDDGRARCSTCGGDGQVSQTENGRTTRHRCSACGGDGRVTCSTCGGSGRVTCSTCDGSGELTHTLSAWLKADVETSIDTRKTPPEFVALLGKRSGEELAAGATVERTKCEPARGHVVASYQFTLPHATLSCTCTTTNPEIMPPQTAVIQAASVGNDCNFIQLSPFIDTLLTPLAEDIMTRTPHGVIRVSRGAAVMSALFRTVCDGNDQGVDTVVNSYHGAVSRDFLTPLYTLMSNAYQAVGEATVKKVWLLSLPVLIAWGAALGTYLPAVTIANSFTARPSTGLQLLIDLVLTLIAVPIVWWLAGHLAVRNLTATVGVATKRRPRQRYWPAVGATVVLTANLAIGALAILR